MEFYKYHGAGNDFILLQTIDGHKADVLAVNMCHRRFGVGADGLMYPENSFVADIKMVYYNSDGSFATMCGNGLRCFSKFVYEIGLVDNNKFTVETGDGIKEVQLHIKEDAVTAVTVEMHSGTLDMRQHHFDMEDKVYEGSYLHLGVPHLVVPVTTISEKEICTTGPVLEKAPFFDNGTNVNFVRVENKQAIHVDTWERGAGYTYACGTGCCATVYALHKKGLLSDKVTVNVKGGVLEIEVLEGDVVMMTGPAIKICKGNYLAPMRG